MIGVDLFAGAGGLTLGAKQAGINVVFAVEADPNAQSTYAVNHPEIKLFRDDIRKLKKISVKKNGVPTILFGGPPCQGFSTSNQRTRNFVNKSNWMFEEFIRLTKSWSPDWIVFENVYGIAGTENGKFSDLILMSFKKLGYTVSHGILNAAYFGVPQKRERLFVIGSLNGTEVKMPARKTTKLIPVTNALADLPCLPNGARTDTL
jgi:DNA (cytosine-5)-methyltransferase 1